MVVGTSINWLAKLAALGIGLGFIAIGIAIIRLGSPAIVALNRLYERLPGRFQYPAWWHRLLGGIFVGFGVLFAIAGVLLAGRQLP